LETFKILQNYFQQLPIELQFVWILSGVLAFFAIIFIIYLKILRNSLRKEEVLKVKLQHKYEGLLLSYLFEESENNELSNDQKEFIKTVRGKINDNFKRKIIVETLLKLKNEVSGEIEISIQNLYLKSNLKEHAFQQLKSKNWYTIANGIKELAQFKVKEAYPEIKKLLKYPKKEVRKEVELYLVSLFHFKGLDFLNHLKINLSEWDQIELLEELKKLDNQEIPDITLWLNSKNDSVVSFSLKLAKIYNKYETVATLLHLLNHENSKIRLQVIDVLTHLQVMDAKQILKSSFKNRSLEEQIATFKMLENIYEPNDENFIFENSTNNNFDIQYSALKILKELNEKSFNNLLVSKNKFKNKRILNFVQNN
jgi:HEAT repeat protein